MKKGNFYHYQRVWGQNGFSLLLILMFVLLSISITAEASDPLRYPGNGELTGTDNNETVTINGNTYFVDSSVLVVDETGKPTHLDQLVPPADVTFEYIYMETSPKMLSPVIVYIKLKETIHTRPEVRSIQ